MEQTLNSTVISETATVPAPLGSAAKSNDKSKLASTVQPSILIYHTHNRESWLPELSKANSADGAFDAKINVTLLGAHLMEKLKVRGLEVIHSTNDYPSQIANFNYAKSYKYSKLTVNDELRQHRSALIEIGGEITHQMT